MAITTGAADTGVLSLDLGSRPRAGMPGDRDSFADALDTQMQNPRTEQPATAKPPKRESPTQPPAANGKTGDDTSAGGDDGKVAKGADDKKDDSAREATDKKTRADAESARGLVALILQTKEGEPRPAETAVPTGGQAASTGKDLPPEAANDAAATLLTPGDARGDLTATAALTRAIDPRLTAVRAPTEAQAGDTSGLSPAPEPGAKGDKETAALLLTGAEGKGVPVTPAGGEKGDAFAAALAALRDVAPRGNGEATAQVNAAAAAAANAPQPNSGAPATAAPTLPTVNVPVGQHGWDQAVGERVLWMTRHGLQEAKIELNPRDLGPIEVKISVQQDQANVAFTTHSPAARDALESAMPRLREMLADSGLNLAQSDVSHRSPQQQAESGWGNGNGQQGSGNPLAGEMEEQPTGVVETPVSSLGAVDYFA